MSLGRTMFGIEPRNQVIARHVFRVAVVSELRSLCLRHLRSQARSDSSSLFFSLVLISKPANTDDKFDVID